MDFVNSLLDEFTNFIHKYCDGDSLPLRLAVREGQRILDGLASVTLDDIGDSKGSTTASMITDPGVAGAWLKIPPYSAGFSKVCPIPPQTRAKPAKLMGCNSHPCFSHILPQPDYSAQDTLLVRHGEVFIPSVERMKFGLTTDFLELPQQGSLRAALVTVDHHIVPGFTRKIRVDENDLALTEERLHRIVFHLHGKGTYPWNVCFKHRFSLDNTRRHFGYDHLIDLIPFQEWHFSHLAEGRRIGALFEVEQSL